MTLEQDPAAHAGFGRELRVDWIEPELLGGQDGKLGLTGLPGKHGLSRRYPGRVYRRDLETDLLALRAAGVVRLILLVEDAELERWSAIDIVGRAAQLGLEIIRHPLPDGAAPASAAEMTAILDELDAARRHGNVAVACMGGVGRSGTVAACALVRAGFSAEEAIERVRAIRHPTAVETAEQEAFVRAFAHA